MLSKCPACSSVNVRRSTIRPSEALAKPRLRSPYRCRDCGERFWVVSRRANYVASLAVFAIVAGIVAWNVASAPQSPRRTSEHVAAPTEALADIMRRAELNEPSAEYVLAHLYATPIPTRAGAYDA